MQVEQQKNLQQQKNLLRLILSSLPRRRHLNFHEWWPMGTVGSVFSTVGDTPPPRGFDIWGWHDNIIEDYMIYFVTAGSGRCVFGDEEHELHGGSLVLIGPDVVFTLVSSRQSPMKVYCGRFGIYNNSSGYRARKRYPLSVVFVPNRLHYYQQIFEGIDRHNRKPHMPVEPGVSSALLHVVLAQVYNDLSDILDGAKSHMQDEIEGVCRLIEGRPTERIALGDMAAMVNLSKAHFIRKFREVTGQTPNQYLIRVRCARAHDLLREGNSVQQTAQTCGYPDMYSFSKQFRKVYGFAPSLLLHRKR